MILLLGASLLYGLLELWSSAQAVHSSAGSTLLEVNASGHVPSHPRHGATMAPTSEVHEAEPAPSLGSGTVTTVGPPPSAEEGLGGPNPVQPVVAPSCAWHVWDGRRLFSGNTGFATRHIPHPVDGAQGCLDACQELHGAPCDYFSIETMFAKDNSSHTMCSVMYRRHEAPQVCVSWLLAISSYPPRHLLARAV